MKKLSLIVLFLFVSTAFSQNAHQLKHKDSLIVKAIFDEALVNGKAYDLLRELCFDIGHRLSGSKSADKAVQWSKKVMEDLKFDHVFLQDVMVPHWERGAKEEAKVISKGEGSHKLSVLANGGSAATPEKGLVANVIQMRSPNDLKDFGKDKIKGKIVFFTRAFDQRFIHTGQAYGDAGAGRFRGAMEAEKFGAVGVVIRTLSSSHEEDDVPHTGAGAPSKIPTASLGIKSSNVLKAILKKDPNAKVFLKINSRNFPDAPSHNVVGELKGSSHRDQFITVGGHLDSWDVGHGAHDDGAGCVHSIEALRILKAIGYKPKRTLRAVMFMNEENGLRGGKKYAELAKKNKENHLVAIESDIGGFTPRGFAMTGSDEQINKVRSWLPYYDLNTINYIQKGGGGADIGPLNKELKTPLIGLRVDSQRYFDIHHTNEDTFDKVNKRELHLGAASLATLIYFLDKYGLN